MSAYRANFWCRIANMNVATVTALPDRNAVTLKVDTSLDFFFQALEAFFMMRFNLANLVKEVGDLIEALFTSLFGELRNLRP